MPNLPQARRVSFEIHPSYENHWQRGVFKKCLLLALSGWPLGTPVPFPLTVPPPKSQIFPLPRNPHPTQPRCLQKKHLESVWTEILFWGLKQGTTRKLRPAHTEEMVLDQSGHF